MNSKPELKVNLFSFDELMKITIENSIKLTEYFRLNLIYNQLISGKGLEFEKIREYTPGDNVTRIDWKILARTKKVYVKTYKEERQFDIIIVMDVSDSMLLGTTEYLKNQFASMIAGVLSYAAIQADDRVGIVLISDKHIIATNPVGNYTDLLKIISDKKNYGGKKDWKNLVNTLISNYNDDAIVFIISDFLDTNPNTFLPPLAASFTKVYGVMILDPIDEKIPGGVGPMYLTDMDASKPYLTNLDSVREDYQVLMNNYVEKLRSDFISHGQLFFKMTTKEDIETAFIKAVGKEQVIIS